MECCELCNGLRGHDVLKRHLAQPFIDEYTAAHSELEQLNFLYRELVWSNYEVKIGKERGATTVALHTHVHDHGRRTLTFPIYYYGSVEQAPVVPPIIVLKELYSAEKYVEAIKEQMNAAYDWAPGGDKYNLHMRTSLMARILSKGRGGEDEHGGSHRLEQEVKEDERAASKDVLGGVGRY